MTNQVSLNKIKETLLAMWNACKSMEGTTDGSHEAMLDSVGFWKETEKLKPFGISWQNLINKRIK